jgi:proteasome accessory factor B
MANYNTIRRLHLLLKKLNGNQYWSLDEILDYLSQNDIEVYQRTIKRDFNSIRTDYGLNLVYSPPHKGYRIEEDLTENVELTSRFFESIASSHALRDVIKNAKQLRSFISYSSDHIETGSPLVKPLLVAIQKSAVVSFEHENLQTETFTNRRVEPYFLKEHKRRWYLLGYDHSSKDFRLFGLDRVTNLIETKESFQPQEFDAQEYFMNTFGVFVDSDQPAELVELQVTGLSGKLMNKVPVHPTQKLVKREGDTFWFTLFVRPTSELRTHILSLGRHTKVVSPESLVNDIKHHLELTLDNYRKHIV